MVRSWWTAGAAVLILAGAPAASVARQASTPPRPGGDGVLCALALMSRRVAVAHQCSPDTAPEAQAEVRRQVERLEGYVLANGMTLPELVALKRQALSDLSDPQMCAAQREEGFRDISEADIAPLRTQIDGLTARPGTPTWGSCI